MSAIPPQKKISIVGTRSNPTPETMDVEKDFESVQEMINDTIETALVMSQVEIFELLLAEVLIRVPYDTDPSRPQGKPHLRDKIRENSRIEGNKIIIGSGNYRDPASNFDYAEWLDNGFATKIGASAKFPATSWGAKMKRQIAGRLEDPSSVTPFMTASVTGNVNNMIAIIVNNITKGLSSIGMIEGITVSGAIA